ncbi:DNA-binding protein [Acrocarpospora pleiomorpha]|uniref:DNA-binding protein n=1 Tax=Acrocarpospora pleiomorpha TaxID=90975 RepID=A0A5M3XFV0_9ACTN|nr:DNA-binding protein [Acrocarpospora pleiomorpha]
MIPIHDSSMAVSVGAARAQPTPTTEPFWSAARDGRLDIQRCDSCATVVFYPRVSCVGCGARELIWVTASGRATLSSFVIVHLPAPGFEDAVPYVLAIVRLVEGPSMMTNIVGVEPRPENLRVDMELEVRFERRAGRVLPVFAPAGGVR